MTADTLRSAIELDGHGSSDRVSVVFLSGMLADQRMWQPTIDVLANGCGDAGHLIEPVFCELFDQDGVGDMATAVLDRAPDRFALVGMSMGGYVAFDILRRAPERVSHLMLVNTRATEDPPKIRRRRMLLAHLVAENTPFKGVNDAMLDDLIHPDNRKDAGLVRLLTAMADDCGPDVFKRQSKAVAERPDSTAVLAEINIPCSVMVGEADRVISPESHRDMANAITGASFAVVPGAGHYVPLEAPVVFADYLVALLRR
ncbi:alpha/beta hydrolase [Thalassospira sp. GB04J01]|uniref:alpha/beta fold hydrolase n=1 Tax=Thalassospira sp. GB04J01 TaxID=1485225 RepID=UPI000C9B02CD|nr:alpha/beta hydrolase [Thalassospira sp. GB04J01]